MSALMNDPIHKARFDRMVEIVSRVPSRNWTRTSIIYELRKRGLTAARMADEAGMSRSSFYSAMQRPYPRVQKMIAAALGLSVHDVWPQYYDRNGNRVGVIASRRAA